MHIRKQSKEQYKRIIMFMISLISLFLLTFSFGFIWYLFYADTIIAPFFQKGNWLLIAVYGILLYVFTRIYGGYKIGYLKCGEVIYSAILSTFFVNIMSYLQVSLIGRSLMNPLPIVAMTGVDVILIVLWAVTGEKIYKRLFPAHKMLLVYGNESAEGLIYKMSSRDDKYNICQTIDIAEGLDIVFQAIDQFDSVIICDVKSDTRNKILKYCFANSIRTYLTPKISDTIVRGAESIHLFDTPLLLCRNQGLSFEQRLAKRTLDLLLSILAAIIATPIMLIISIGIKLQDSGPIFFKQKRVTLDGKKFNILKFRSMVVDAEKAGLSVPAQNKDPRVTPIGKIIRKIRFDELPQLLNIIKGEMSIVGPRPERVEHVEKYTSEIPEFTYRLKVKSGLTGYAQILGKYNTTALDKLKLDLIYIENYSFILDLKLILMTIKILFIPESTEGFKETTNYSENAKEIKINGS